MQVCAVCFRYRSGQQRSVCHSLSECPSGTPISASRVSSCSSVVSGDHRRRKLRCTFGENPRYDESGVLKGVRNPGNMKLWFNPVGPGQYQQLDGIESAARVHWMSSPAWSQRRGKPAEDVRAAKAAGCAPGPGYYAPQTKVEPRGKRTVCKNAGQFSLIFQRIGASAGPNSYVPRRRSEAVEPLGSDYSNSAPPSRG